jgi:hypothetical protein
MSACSSAAAAAEGTCGACSPALIPRLWLAGAWARAAAAVPLGGRACGVVAEPLTTPPPALPSAGQPRGFPCQPHPASPAPAARCSDAAVRAVTPLPALAADPRRLPAAPAGGPPAAAAAARRFCHAAARDALVAAGGRSGEASAAASDRTAGSGNATSDPGGGLSGGRAERRMVGASAAAFSRSLARSCCSASAASPSSPSESEDSNPLIWLNGKLADEIAGGALGGEALSPAPPSRRDSSSANSSSSPASPLWATGKSSLLRGGDSCNGPAGDSRS